MIGVNLKWAWFDSSNVFAGQRISNGKLGLCPAVWRIPANSGTKHCKTLEFPVENANAKSGFGKIENLISGICRIYQTNFMGFCGNPFM